MPQEIMPQDSATVDHSEGQMARADLYRAAKNAMKLFELVHTGQQLEGWVQAKITKAADYLDSVYHYMEYQAKFGAGGTASSLEDIISDASMPSQKKEVSEEDDEKMEESMNYEQKLHALLEGAKQKAMVKKKPAGKDEKVKEGFPTVADAKARAEKQKTTGKFDKKQTSTGTQYTRKASTFTDGGDDADTKNAKKKAKSVKEGFPTVAGAREKAEKEKTTGKFDKKQTSTGTQYTRKASTFTDGGDDTDTKKAKQKARSVKEGPDEGNEFSGELKKAKDSGAKQFKVAGKTYQVKEGSKPDFLDIDKDGDKKEPMKKAAADKGSAKTDGKKGMSDKQAKYFGKKTESVSEVAGAQKCWPGHRKAGTQPGTGENAGKRVNKCVKVKESVEVEKPVITESADLARLKVLTKKLLG